MLADNKGVALHLYDIVLICAIVNPYNAHLCVCAIVWCKCYIGVAGINNIDVADLQIFNQIHRVVCASKSREQHKDGWY